jgi:hypothetical protein
MTGQGLLDRMELLNQELQLQPGEADVTRGLLALNVAQDYFESLAAVRKGVLGSTKGTVVTVDATESTAFPAGVLRIDRLFLLNGTRPVRELRRLQRTGGQAANNSWPNNLLSNGASGTPVAYWTDGSLIYWEPLPAGVSTIRWHGFQTVSDLSASGTFAYPDIVALPLAAFAARLMKSSVDDSPQDVAQVAVETFTPVLNALSMFNRDGASGLEYTQSHSE